MEKNINFLRRVSSNLWIILALVVMTVLFMLPRLHSAQFGLFDDPNTLVTVEKMAAGDFHWQDDPSVGRFRPMYWIYPFVLYALGGKQPVWFFVGNWLLLAGLVVGLYGFVRRSGGGRLHASLTAIFLLLSGPVIENTYTLSKPELQQTFWLMMFLLITRRTIPTKRWRQIGLFSLACLMALLVCLSKETGAILPVVLIAWTILAWLFERFGRSIHTSSRQWLYWTTAALVGVGLFFVLRSFSYPYNPLEQGYGAKFTFSPGFWLSQINAWRSWLQRDYLYLAPLVIMPFVWLVMRRHLAFGAISSGALIWMIVWWGMYIPWVFVVEYYLLPFSVGAAVLTGNLVWNHLEMIRFGRWPIRFLALGGIAISAFFWLLTLPNNASNAGLQLATDAANSDMIHYVAENLPAGSVVLINIQEPNEYVEQIQRWLLDVEERSDLQVDYFHGQKPDEQGWEEVYVLMPIVENEFFPSVRRGIYELSAQQWNQSLHDHFGESGEEIYSTFHQSPVFTVNALRLFCPLIRRFGYCEYVNSAFNREPFAFGWQVRRISAP